MTLDSFFRPKSVAVIGASRDPKKPGHVIFRNLLESGYKGRVTPVNIHAETILGVKCYSSIMAVKEKVELAVIAIPAPFVPEALEQCGKAGVKAAIILAGGFSEVGNKELENRTKQMLKKYKMRAIGPNCLGLYDAYSGIDTLFNPKYKLGRPASGPISFISQSGAILTAVADWMSMKGYRASKFISYGNAIDVDEAELLEYLAKDPHTRVICIYIEGVREGRRFFEAAKNVSSRKPIIALKGGITTFGSKAVGSHTGSLAGSARIYSAMFRQAGIIEATNMESLFDIARTLSKQPKPKGPRVQVITDGGGFGILAADHIYKYGLQLARMSPSSIASIKKQLPPHIVTDPIIDLTGSADENGYRTAINAALDDDNVDILMVIALFQLPSLGGEIVDVIAEANSMRKKPMVFIAAGGKFTEMLKKSIEDNGVPTFSYPEQAVMAIKALADYSKNSKLH